jgi:pilus assembly protein CpaB
MTSTCLQNILVLSAGQIMQADPRGQAMPSPTVTLLVTPDQAETLTLAGNDGKIQLVLRNSSDQTIERTSGRVVTELYNGHRSQTPTKPQLPEELQQQPKPRPRPVVARAPLPPAPVPVAVVTPPPAPAPPDQIIMIRGTQRTVETLPAGGSKN